MEYEVDLLAVGDGSRSGDAIALRFGNFHINPQDQKVIVIDGGFQDSGKKLVERIKNEYGTTHVDLVISTHPDSDHINGLRIILEELTVGELWMHTPWNISDDVRKMAEDRGLDVQLGTTSTIKKSLQAAYDLEQLAISKGINIVEPFEGLTAFNGKIHVLGPHLDYYYELAGQFDVSTNSTNSTLASILTKIKESITEFWHEDKLEDPAEDAVNARNNSSVIVLFQGGKNFLFFGDSGVPSITKAADYADSLGFNIATRVDYLHVPHHGSKRNLGPTILDRIVGPKLLPGENSGKHAFVSAGVGNSKHPSKRVKNALIRRGVKVSETCGSHNCYSSPNAPSRSNWGPIQHVEFCDSYDEE